MGDIRIRPYRAEDRAGVREVAFQTGYMGEPVDWLWRDARSFADVTTSYYTDREPESLWVADDGDVAGYLMGCRDSRRVVGFAAATMRRILLRGGLARPGLARFLWRAVFDVLGDRGAPDEAVDDPLFPAHLHLNLLPRARGRGAGAALIDAWLGRLRDDGAPGLHLGTFAENHNGIAFFGSRGFERLGEPQRTPGFRTREGERMHVQWMVRRL